MRMLLALLMVVLVAAHAWAEEGSRGFSNADIKGNYSWLAQGSAVVSGTHIAFPIVIIGTVFSDGRGTMQGTGTVNPGGPVSGLTPGQQVPLSITYEVDADGTGQWSAATNPSACLLCWAAVRWSSGHLTRSTLSAHNPIALFPQRSRSAPPSRGFSNATLAFRGRSRATGRSSPRPGAPPTPVIVPVAVIGLMTNDGHGNSRPR